MVAQQNDVILLHNKRLYFLSNCWRKEDNENNKDVEFGVTEFHRVKSQLNIAQSKVESQFSHETGDRQFDDDNEFGTTMTNINMLFLVREGNN